LLLSNDFFVSKYSGLQKPEAHHERNLSAFVLSKNTKLFNLETHIEKNVLIMDNKKNLSLSWKRGIDYGIYE